MYLNEKRINCRFETQMYILKEKRPSSTTGTSHSLSISFPCYPFNWKLIIEYNQDLASKNLVLMFYAGLTTDIFGVWQDHFWKMTQKSLSDSQHTSNRRSTSGRVIATIWKEILDGLIINRIMQNIHSDYNSCKAPTSSMRGCKLHITMEAPKSPMWVRTRLSGKSENFLNDRSP